MLSIWGLFLFNYILFFSGSRKCSHSFCFGSLSLTSLKIKKEEREVLDISFNLFINIPSSISFNGHYITFSWDAPEGIQSNQLVTLNIEALSRQSNWNSKANNKRCLYVLFTSNQKHSLQPSVVSWPWFYFVLKKFKLFVDVCRLCRVKYNFKA